MGAIGELAERERARFAAERPRSAELRERALRSMPNGVPMQWFVGDYRPMPIFVESGKGARFRDVDGYEYSDFNIADISAFCGYAPDPVVEAVARRASLGTQFLLPSEDAVWVAEELGRRWRLPKWQFTLSASQANVEAIRVARVATGRDKVLLFDGKYHGHFDDALVELREGELVPEEAGLPRDVTKRARVIQFNDVEGLERALASRDVALVLAEPAMTNNNGLILPEPGYHEHLRRLTREAGTLLALDETHTLCSGPGGLVRVWGLEPDLVTLGKSIGGGVPIGAWGATEEVASVLWRGDVATGGTLFANPLSMAAARAALGAVLTDEAYARTAALGARLADAMRAAVRDVGLEWTIHRLFARSGYSFAPTLPRNAIEARAHHDWPLVHLLRLYLANRGVWEAIPGAGPTVSVAATREDVERYVGAFVELLDELTS